MEFEKLFSVVVLSGAMLTSGCGKKESETAETVRPTDAAAASRSPVTSEEAPASRATTDLVPPKLTKEGERCDEICDGLTDDGEVICPIPDGEGGTNCCWLMMPRHECCPS